MAGSPSEFLTFYRRLSTSQSLRRCTIARPVATRQFHVSSTAMSTGKSDVKPHATQKDNQLDVQSDAVGSGKESRTQDKGGSATRQKDEQGSVAKAKKDFPESPDPAIGMQDERGGKGH